MIIPRYWADAKMAITMDGKTQTYRRFGWSNDSEADAELSARKHVEDACVRAKAGERVRRVDHKVAYNGAEGLPIREEVIKTFDDSVLSRNSYGSLCLNTPDVVFADVDVIPKPNYLPNVFGYIALVAGAVIGASMALPDLDSWLVVAAMVGFLGIFEALKRYAARNWLASPAKKALKRIRDFSSANVDWRLRVYRTPQGYRVLVMHSCFSPDSTHVQRFFSEIGTDPNYVRMCNNQQCFRARVSPKPWRIGLNRVDSGSGVWPVKPEHLRSREKWLRRYEQESRAFASCVYIESLGANQLDVKAERIRAIHDEYSQAGRDLPLA